ncbi:uncharacterized protein DNG_02667 [Cephalotrichum gorgonifer]|uniref:2EXR domain-containing protein n=1 Tax=Cephalotrichum gorgonifer TaxID=2041049 RepID=A0AAE8MVG8_9PEZI|nr:uncharacterized protein DNG_02667 [Cephalotrichum gorgonifer]
MADSPGASRHLDLSNSDDSEGTLQGDPASQHEDDSSSGSEDEGSSAPRKTRRLFDLEAADSDDDESGENDEEDDEEESDEEDERGGGLFDLEAADDDEDDESSEDGSSDAGSSVSSGAEEYFPRFMRLPPELRRRVWEFFCPEALGVPRLLEFVWDMKSKKEPISEGSSTAYTTYPARTLAAVQGESRELALRAFPDVLKLSDRRGEVRFHSKRDVVVLQHIRAYDISRWSCAPGFSDQVRHLAIDKATLWRMGDPFVLTGTIPDNFDTTFPNLDKIYEVSHRSEFQRDPVWAESDKVNRFTLKTEDYTGCVELYEERPFIWPDLENHRDFAEAQTDGPSFLKLDDSASSPDDAAIKRSQVEVWPMVEWSSVPPDSSEDELDEDEDEEEEPGYMGQSIPPPIVVPDGLDGFDSDGEPLDQSSPSDMQPTWHGVDSHGLHEVDYDGVPFGVGSDEAGSDEEDLDQYEDDFIVDDGVIEYDEDGSDILDGESGAEDSDGGDGYPSGFDHPGASVAGGGLEAGFSDLEPESESEPDEEDVIQAPVRQRGRRAVISEDEGTSEVGGQDEDEDEDDVRRVPVRSRGRRTVISEDEEEDE